MSTLGIKPVEVNPENPENPENPGSDRITEGAEGTFHDSEPKSDLSADNPLLKAIGYILEIPINRHTKNYKIH